MKVCEHDLPPRLACVYESNFPWPRSRESYREKQSGNHQTDCGENKFINGKRFLEKPAHQQNAASEKTASEHKFRFQNCGKTAAETQKQCEEERFLPAQLRRDHPGNQREKCSVNNFVRVRRHEIEIPAFLKLGERKNRNEN